jgi:hypothetical protein
MIIIPESVRTVALPLHAISIIRSERPDHGVSDVRAVELLLHDLPYQG